MKYAYSLLATIGPYDDIRIRHALGFVEATNEWEAKGKVEEIIRKLYPVADGWINHHTLVRSVLDPSVDPDKATLGKYQNDK